MISEPELVGGPAFPEPGAPVYVPPPPSREESPSRSRRPWLWALGGAVAASAVWAGGLVAYDRYAATEGPDLRGYRAVDPCRAGSFHGLSSALGRRGEFSTPMELDRPGLYRIVCSVALDAKKPVYHSVEVTYRLHRVIDPRPEFEARMTDPYENNGDRIDGIGDIAFLNDSDDAMVLDVLDGQAELRIAVNSGVEWNGEGEQPPAPPRLDPAALRTYLVEDAHELMTALKKN